MIGCQHRSSEANLLRPLASVYSTGFPDDSIQPQYLAFADPLTASILKNLVRNGPYRIAPPGPLFCPSNPAAGNHGYQLRLLVRNVMGDSAIVAAEQMCATGYGIISTGVNYLVHKKRRKWEIVRPISGWITPMGMAMPPRKNKSAHA